MKRGGREGRKKSKSGVARVREERITSENEREVKVCERESETHVNRLDLTLAREHRNDGPISQTAGKVGGEAVVGAKDRSAAQNGRARERLQNLSLTRELQKGFAVCESSLKKNSVKFNERRSNVNSQCSPCSCSTATSPFRGLPARTGGSASSLRALGRSTSHQTQSGP